MIRMSGFWIPVIWSFLPDKNLESYKVLFFLLKEELKKRGIKFNIKQIISDFEINIQKGLYESFEFIEILGCYFHFADSIQGKVQKKGFSTQYEEFSDFKRFVRSTIGLVHLPLEDLEKGFEFLKDFQISDE